MNSYVDTWIPILGLTTINKLHKAVGPSFIGLLMLLLRWAILLGTASFTQVHASMVHSVGYSTVQKCRVFTLCDLTWKIA